MSKARLSLTPVEVEYNRRFGICWEYHFDRLRKKGYSLEQASEIIENNTKECYLAICERKKQEEEEMMNRYEWHPYYGTVPF